MAICLKDLYWLAGILEGEGCFNLRKRTRENTKRGSSAWADEPMVQVSMTDKDIVERVAALFNKNCRGPYILKSGKFLYTTNVTGSKAIQWMMTLYSLMGARRKNKIEEIIDYWKNNHTGKRGPKQCAL